MIEDAEQKLQGRFSSKIEISQWAEGYSFTINKEKQFNELTAWLQIENNNKRV